MTDETTLILIDKIEPMILEIRGQKVVLASDLSRLYGVSTKALNQAVKRNVDRFPPDFMFQLSANEKQEVVTNCDHLSQLRFSSTLPFVFTEHGVVMAASVLNSPRAVEASVFVVRAFVNCGNCCWLTRSCPQRTARGMVVGFGTREPASPR